MVPSVIEPVTEPVITSQITLEMTPEGARAGAGRENTPRMDDVGKCRKNLGNSEDYREAAGRRRALS